MLDAILPPELPPLEVVDNDVLNEIASEVMLSTEPKEEPKAPKQETKPARRRSKIA